MKKQKTGESYFGFEAKMRIPQKYIISKDDKYEIKTVFLRFLKIALLFLSIKLFRIYLLQDDTIPKGLISEFLTLGSPEDLIKFIALQLMFMGILGICIFYLFMGTKLLKTKLFNILLFLFLIEGIYMYSFPEIHIAIFKAIVTIP